MITHRLDNLLQLLRPGAARDGCDPTMPGLCATRPAQIVADRILENAAERNRLLRSEQQYAAAGLTDFYFGNPRTPSDPDAVFARLRWGGQFVYVTPRQRDAQHLFAQYAGREEYAIDTAIEAATCPRFGIPFPPLNKRHYYFAARKVMLTRPGEVTDRYSYDVRLAPAPGQPHGYVVLKQVPTLEGAMQRLALRFPEADEQMIAKSARKLVDKVFPVFLTREAALLKILHRELPEKYHDRFPHVVQMEKDDRGFVNRMYLNWMRLGGEPMSQIDFAHQSAELLSILHETAKIIHLDLRLDNFVITGDGVGFVDFGSAVRDGEDLTQSQMLSTLFSEMLSTSQIQRDLKSLVKKGKVTSSLFANSYQKIDKAVDLFYLVLQMNRPHANPEFRGLVDYDVHTDQAHHLSRLSREILQPANPDHPRYRTARDVVAGIEQLETQLSVA